MNEATICARLEAEYKLQLGGCVVIKHADRATIGVPDMSLTWRYRTSWVEVKYLRPDDLDDFPVIEPHKILGDAAQQLMMYNLRMAGNAYYLIYTDEYIIYMDPVDAMFWAKKEERIELSRFDNPTPALKERYPAFYMKKTPSMPALIAIHFHGGKVNRHDEQEGFQQGASVSQEERTELGDGTMRAETERLGTEM